MGRPNKIESPERMWELFQEYKRYVKNNPILKHTFVGKEGRSEYSELEKDKWQTSLETAIEYYAEKEEYDKCIECRDLITKI